MHTRRFLIKDEYLVEVRQSEDALTPSECGFLGRIAGTGSLGSYDIKIEKGKYSSLEEAVKDLVGKDSVYLPIYVYHHGDISISTTPYSCSWDSWSDGFIYVTHEDIKKEYGDVTEETIEKVIEILENEVNYLSNYIGGNIFEYYIYELDDRDRDYLEKIRSCNLNSYWANKDISRFLNVVSSISDPLNIMGGFIGDDMKENGMLESILNDIPNCDKKYPNLNIENELIEYSELEE